MLGWGSLIAAAGVSFYYAKKTINERRAMQEMRGQRPSEKLDCTCTLLPDVRPSYIALQGGRESSKTRSKPRQHRQLSRRRRPVLMQALRAKVLRDGTRSSARPHGPAMTSIHCLRSPVTIESLSSRTSVYGCDSICMDIGRRTVLPVHDACEYPKSSQQWHTAPKIALELKERKAGGEGKSGARGPLGVPLSSWPRNVIAEEDRRGWDDTDRLVRVKRYSCPIHPFTSYALSLSSHHLLSLSLGSLRRPPPLIRRCPRLSLLRSSWRARASCLQ